MWNVEGGTEIISTEDMVGNVVELNEGMDGWNEGHASDGVEDTQLVGNAWAGITTIGIWMTQNGANARNVYVVEL